MNAPEQLEKKQRQRPIMMTWLDPVLSLFFVGTLLWELMTRSPAHVVAALAGGLCGVPLGVARAKAVYVRAIVDVKMVVFRRSALEYGLLAVLLLLRSAENWVASMRSGPATLVLTGLVALGVVESVARCVALSIRYYRETKPGT